LSHAAKTVDGISGIAVIRFTDEDVVRHSLVTRIVRAYDRDERDGGRRGANEKEPR
jgi:phosphate starvation-inducible PhoH-like protein